MPILGIIASAISGNLFAPSGAYDSIATTTLSSTTATITFSSIPATYKHLQLRCFAKNNTVGAGDTAYQIAFNSDTTYTNYRTHYLQGEGSTVYAGDAQVAGLYAVIGVAPRAGSTSIFGAGVTDILDYANTNKNTTTRSLDGDDFNGSGSINFRSALWINTAAVNQIDITLYGGASFTQYSSFALYGIRGGN